MWLRRRPILYLVTNGRCGPGQSSAVFLDPLLDAVHAGIDVIQVRERALSDRALADRVRQAIVLGRGGAVPVLVNDRLDVALATGADGIHLREDSVGADRVRAIVPPGFAIGRSVHSLASAHTAAESGCDYLLVGSVYPSPSKPAGYPTVGVSLLGEICRRIPLPVIAIGGINESNASAVAEAGAAGIAAISAFGDRSMLASRVNAFRAAFDRGSGTV
jgi:thiamine-phosphate pyrophosphorylase